MARLTVTLNDELYASIDRLASLKGVTKSSLINEFMGASIPAMDNISRIIEHLRTATDAEKQAFKDGLDDLASTACLDLDRLRGQMDLLASPSALRLVKTPSV